MHITHGKKKYKERGKLILLQLNKIYCGNCIDVMKQICDDTIDLTVTSPPYDCYSQDTEILTLNGWKLIKDVSIGENVMTLNPNNRNIYYQPVKNKFNYEFDGELINFKNQDIDLMVTENHNMFITDKNWNIIGEKEHKQKKNWLRPAIKINGSGHIPYNGYLWNGKDEQFFILPKLQCIYNKQLTIFDEIKIPMIDWVRFIGIYLAEGSCRNTINKHDKVKTYQISLKQKYEPFVSMIESVFSNLPFTYKKRICNDNITVFSITNRQLWDYLFKLGNSHEKYIPFELKQLSTKYINQMLLYMFIGDGTKSKSGFNGEISSFESYQSFSNILKNDVQQCLLKLGKLSTIRKNYVTNKQYNNIKYVSFKKENVYYNGNVVCVEVPEHNIICVRRNGKVVFCGNCLRKYKGYSFDFQGIANQLFRITKKGGVLVWVVGDATIKGSQTGTSFRQALYFKEIGFNIHDTMIFKKSNPIPLTHNRYEQYFEYMFVFSKGKPNTFNPIMEQCKTQGTKTNWKNAGRVKQAAARSRDEITITKSTKIKGNIFQYVTGSRKGETGNHPAPFPLQLASDHILSWSNQNDIILDPFAGSGTTCKAAKINNRNFIGIQISQEYCEIINERMVKEI